MTRPLSSSGALTLLNMAWTSLKLRFPFSRLRPTTRAGPLDSRLENQPFMGLRLCQSRNGATNSTIAEESFPGDVTRQRSKPAEFPEQRVELNTWHPKQRTHAGNETSIEPALNQSKQVQTEFLILTKPLKFDLNAVTKQRFVRDHFLVKLSYEVERMVFFHTQSPSKLSYAYVCMSMALSVNPFMLE